MLRQRVLSLITIFTWAILFLMMLIVPDRPAGFAAQPAINSENEKDVAGQIKELQKQITELQSQVTALKTPRIVAAGTATIKLGPTHDNRTSIRVKLRGDVVAHLGDNCLVQLTNRYPTRNSFFVAYWKPATDGFDITLADPALVGTAIISQRDQNEPYYIDWIVVQK
jgi:hypothetical protein